MVTSIQGTLIMTKGATFNGTGTSTWEDGTHTWYNASGRYHREHGPAIIHSNGTTRWFLNGKLHRRGAPAVLVSNGCEKWFINGRYHRVDGPADDKRSDGKVRWFVQGEQVYTFKRFQQLTNCSDTLMVMLKLKYKMDEKET